MKIIFCIDCITLKGEVSHEMVQDMPYVDQFINEILRMYPPAVRYCFLVPTRDGSTDIYYM